MKEMDLLETRYVRRLPMIPDLNWILTIIDNLLIIFTKALKTGDLDIFELYYCLLSN
ncbi:MAG: hypothetical protein ACTSRU_02840 [Candidatus Hodarchaeales archaeon]